MRGFINGNGWIFNIERPQKREKTNKMDTLTEKSQNHKPKN